MSFIDFVLANKDKWDWEKLSKNPNIKWENIVSYSDIPWNWRGLSMNPSITWKNVQENPDKPWD